MLKKVIGSLAGISFLLAATPLYAHDTSFYKWGAWADTEVDLGSRRSIGQLDGFAPILQNDSSVFFLNPHVRVDTQDSQEYSLGVGYRTIWSHQWISGFYGYVDRTHSQYGNNFNQVILGAEAMTNNWKLRTNLYQSFGERYQGGVNPQAVVNGGNLNISSDIESALNGNDIELGYRVPLYKVDSMKQLWVYAGGYRFTASGIDAVQGPRVRVEYELGDLVYKDRDIRLKFSGEIENDSARGTQEFAGLRIGIPLGSLGLHKNTSKLTPLERHVIDPVVRDVDILTRLKAAPLEAAVNNYTGNVITAFDTVKAGDDVVTRVNTAGANSVVVFDGSNGAIATSAVIIAHNGQALLSGAEPLSVSGANTHLSATYTPATPAATINGNVSGAAVVTLAPYTIASGLNVNNTSNTSFSHAIYGDGADHSLVKDNTTSTVGTSSYGVGLFNSPNSTIIHNNITTSGLSADAIDLFTSDNSIIAGNITSVAHALDISENSSNVIIRNNTITALNDSRGMFIQGNNVNVFDNTILATGNSTIALAIQLADNVSVNSNNITANGAAGVYIANATNLSGNNNLFSTTNATPLCNNGVGGNSGSIYFNGGGVCQ